MTQKALSSLWDTLNYYEIEPEGMDYSAIQHVDASNFSLHRTNLNENRISAEAEIKDGKQSSTETIKTEKIPDHVLMAFSEAAAAFEQDVPAANQQDMLEDKKQPPITNDNQSELNPRQVLLLKSQPFPHVKD